jgi:energy-coupling factor transport system ATP-binding protein
VAAIEIKGLTYFYSGVPRRALSDLTLSVEREEFVVLTGPSGCGKTTLCRCLNGLIPHFYGGRMRGKVEVAGLDVKEHPISVLAQHVGLVFQNPENQLFALSVEKDVAFGLENLGLDRAEIRSRVDWALEMTGILDLKDSAPFELSGGQQQRASIASVLAMMPEVMVFDEPTSFLDPLSAREIFEVISKINKELQLTVIIVEHRLDLASLFADRVIVLDDGEIVIDGSPRDVFLREETRLRGVGIPKVSRLFQMLRDEGISFSRLPVTIDEAADEVRGLLRRD